MIGRTVSNYRVLAKIGMGSSGAVYKAEHLTLGTSVALKFIHPENLWDPDNRTRFAREARSAARLDHASICKVFDYGENEDGAYLAMDYVDGENLRDFIAKGPVQLDDAVLIAIQIAEGLEHAHNHGIIHRDIKPSNLMVANPDNGRAQIRILNFGVARSLDTTRVTRTGGIVGTASYMSPEQAMGQEVDFRTDLWSLGVCLYQMVTGRVPFKGDYEHAIQYALLNSEPTPVGTLRPDSRPELRRIIKKSLNKNLEDRYQSASEMLVDLRALRLEISAVLPPVMGWLWKYRNRLALGVGAITILVLLGFVIIPLLQPRLEANPFEKGRTRRITHSAAWEAEPSLSPDGNLVAFTSNAAGNLDIYWVGLAGGDPVRLTDDPADDRDPCWLADGSGIVFTILNQVTTSGVVTVCTFTASCCLRASGRRLVKWHHRGHVAHSRCRCLSSPSSRRYPAAQGHAREPGDLSDGWRPDRRVRCPCPFPCRGRIPPISEMRDPCPRVLSCLLLRLRA